MKKKEKKKENKTKANQEKIKGNEHYKNRKFEDALKHYDLAIGLDPEDMTFYLNKSAVYFDQALYEKSIELAEESLKVGKKK